MQYIIIRDRQLKQCYTLDINTILNVNTNGNLADGKLKQNLGHKTVFYDFSTCSENLRP